MIHNEGKKVFKTKDGRVVVETIFSGESLTQQQFKDEVNAVNIMKKYAKTGQINPMNLRMGTGIYGDFTNMPDYQESLQTVIQASQAFADLPSEIRTKFGHDPSQLIQFLQNPENVDEAVKLGLMDLNPDFKGHEAPPTAPTETKK